MFAACGTPMAPGTGPMTFMAVAPCPTEASYTAGNTVTFPGGGAEYTPKCLKVSAGQSVTFTATQGDFAAHPLEPSKMRGTTSGSPIVPVATDTTSKSFVFGNPGFFAYYCRIHGSQDDGMMMAGVVWADAP